jgi:hypothetical protein
MQWALPKNDARKRRKRSEDWGRAWWCNGVYGAFVASLPSDSPGRGHTWYLMSSTSLNCPERIAHKKIHHAENETRSAMKKR